ncbi:MAG: hypothetical protein PUC65_10810 [Clostridiales bacterium]|nr:hypothetical protein [Clostridiales bacterium]
MIFLYDFDRYEEIIQKIKSYYGTSFREELFLQGGCYWLADYLHNHLTHSYIMINKEKEHCAIEIQNELYDITGKITSRHYVWATERNIAYMKKHYRPKFNTQALEQFLNENSTPTPKLGL